jgi:predicted dehydrogenase
VGEIVRVSAHLGSYAQGTDAGSASDAALLAVEFAGGAQGVIQVSAVAHTGEQGQEQRVVLYGDAGTLQVYGSATGAEVRGIRDGEDRWQDLPVPDELWAGVNREQPFVPQVLEIFCRQPVGDRQFVDAILSGTGVSPSFLDGLRAQEVLDGALASHERRCWVTIGGGTGAGAGV